MGPCEEGGGEERDEGCERRRFKAAAVPDTIRVKLPISSRGREELVDIERALCRRLKGEGEREELDSTLPSFVYSLSLLSSRSVNFARTSSGLIPNFISDSALIPEANFQIEKHPKS